MVMQWFACSQIIRFHIKITYPWIIKARPVIVMWHLNKTMLNLYTNIPGIRNGIITTVQWRWIVIGQGYGYICITGEGLNFLIAGFISCKTTQIKYSSGWNIRREDRFYRI